MKTSWQAILTQAAADAGCSVATAREAYRALQVACWSASKKNQQTTLNGFGSIQVGTRAARIGRNPRNQQVIRIKTKKYAILRIAPSLKMRIKTVGFA